MLSRVTAEAELTLELQSLEFTASDLPLTQTVLIVDDDELVLGELRGLIVAAGHRCVTATTGIEALAILESGDASIVLTDFNMPGMSGIELCRRIRAQPWPRHIHLLMLTIRDNEEDILAGLDAGADDYLSKRISRAQIAARLKTAGRIVALENSLRHAVEQQRQQAMTDALTGAYNRRYFLKHLGQELKRLRRQPGESSLLLLDIDHFKHVNDTFGHAIGDVVLQKVTALMSQSLQRETDWCARLGGEEFVVVLSGCTGSAAHFCAERLRETVAGTSIDTPAGRVNITVSIGISTISDLTARGATVESLLAEADVNLYASKAAGRNRVTSRTP